jgi:hypothetical protein
MKNSKWEKPEFKGLTLLGPWRECGAMTIAQERGTVIVEETDLCMEVGCQPETIEEYLVEHFVEHNIHAVMEGKEGAAERTLSVVREHSEPRVHFQVRLFSPNDRADSEWPERLRRRGLRVM